MIYLAKYRTHKTVESLNNSVKIHIYNNNNKLTKNHKNVLQCIAKHSLKHVGACKLKALTIADETGLSRSTVTRAIKTLKDLDVIEVHNDTKLNGIKGANIYTIIFLKQDEPPNEPSEMKQRETHETLRNSKVQHVKNHTESFNSFNPSFNSFVNKNVVNNVNACATEQDLKLQLRDIYQPSSVESNRNFEELCKIAYGRLSQYMKSHNVPYFQMREIVTRCMKSLVNKRGVRNQFAMYSSMIQRQVLQLFEHRIEPQSAFNKPNKELIPDWYYEHNDSSKTVNNMDLELERQKIYAKWRELEIGGNL